MHLAGAEVEVEPVDGADAAEGQHDIAQRQPGMRRLLAEQRRQQVRARHDRAVARAAARRLRGSISAAMPPGIASTITSSSAA